MNQKQPLVFGDPEQSLTVGVFVRWLEEHWAPHYDMDKEQSAVISSINVALIGNGTPEGSIKHRVDQMWTVSQRLDAALTVFRWIWITVGSLVGGLMAVILFFKQIGVW